MAEVIVRAHLEGHVLEPAFTSLGEVLWFQTRSKPNWRTTVYHVVGAPSRRFHGFESLCGLAHTHPGLTVTTVKAFEVSSWQPYKRPCRKCIPGSETIEWRRS